MPINGKGFFIWMLPRCEGGDPYAIAHVAKQAGLEYVIIKVADTLYPYNVYNGVDVVPPVVQQLKAQGIQAWGWHYIKGGNPTGEANKAIERVTQLDLDGYVLNAEAEYKESGKQAAAQTFMQRLRAGLPNTPIALSSYRYPSYHPQLPWQAFLERCDFNMPQVYWMHSSNAGAQLRRSVREFEALTPFRPIIPTGAAFKEWGWIATAEQVVDFLQTAESLNLKSVNFYSWDHARTYLRNVWDTIKNYPWLGDRESADLSAKYIHALNSHTTENILTLYNPNAVHITSNRSIQGYRGLRSWFQNFLNKMLPNATFTLTNHIGSGSFRYFTWTAVSNNGSVHNGSDTIGIIDDKISYHYSFFSLSS
jgi:hypothetical protein